VQNASQRRYRYIGSWHTHPFGRARPSRSDIAAVRAISREPQVLLRRPLLMILATRPSRRTYRERNVRMFMWNPDLSALIAVDLQAVREDERQYPVLAVDWDTVVA